MTREISILGRRIGNAHPPYVVAELSANHNGDIEKAFRIIEVAKAAGADAVKLQTYRPDTITIRSDRDDFRIAGGLWDGHTLYDLYEWAHTPWEWHEDLFRKAREVGIAMFSSPFDFTAIELLESLDAPAYKIASFELVDMVLIEQVARTGKPMIMSTGMANDEEIAEALDTARTHGCGEIVLLHCVSGYPAPADEYNLRTIPDMIERFSVPTGLSDHTLDNATAIASIALGACVIEKHVTLDRNGGGPDDSFSLEPPQLEALCRDAHTAWASLGNVTYANAEAEKGNVKFRRSLYAVADIEAGAAITMDNVRSIRPGYGLPPKHLKEIVGRTAARRIERGTPVAWDLLA